MTIERIDMTPDVAQIMKRSFDGDDYIIIKQVQTGRARLYKYQDSKSGECGYFITRVDFNNELCLVAGESASGLWLFKTIMPAIEQIARFFECQTIRFHTKRKGFIKYSKKLGFIERERIYYKQVYGE